MKMQDPGSFTIPCIIGNTELGKDLCDSRASINLIPLSVVKRLSLGELTPIAMTLQMADNSMVQPKGILEDILIKVGKFIFLVDFVVMNIEEDKQVPLLLGRPFLATRATLIDVKKEELTLKVGDEAAHLYLNQGLKQFDDDNVDCKSVQQIIPISTELIYDCKIQNSMNKNEMNCQYIEARDVEYLNSSFEIKTTLNLKEISTEKSSTDEEEEQGVEKSSEGLILKELPKYLKYAFLEAEIAQLLIIATDLTKEKKAETIENSQKV